MASSSTNSHPTRTPRPGHSLLDGISSRLNSSTPSGTKRLASTDLSPAVVKRQMTSSLSQSALSRELATSNTEILKTKSQLKSVQNELEKIRRDNRLLNERFSTAEEKWEQERKTLEITASSAHENEGRLRRRLGEVEDQRDEKDAEVLQLRRRVAELEMRIHEEKERAARRPPRLSEVLRVDDGLTRTMEFTLPSFSAPAHDDSAEELKALQASVVDLERQNNDLLAETLVLREKKENVDILLEEKRGLSEQVRRLGRENEKLVREMETLRRSPSRSSVATTSAASTSQLTRDLESLRSEHYTLLNQMGELREQLASAQATTSFTAKQLEATTSAKQAISQQLQDVEDELQSLKSEADRWEREVNWLKAELESYRRESSMANDARPSEDEDKSLAYITHLESQISELRSSLSNTSLSASTSRRLGLGSSTSTLSLGGSSLEKELLRLREVTESQAKEITTYLTQIDTLEQRVHDLCGELATGELVPPGRRVLQLADNPATQWFDTREALVKELREESHMLRERVKELEVSASNAVPSIGAHSMEVDEGEIAGRGTMPMASYTLLEKSLQEREAEVKLASTKIERLRTVFNQKSMEFRNVVEKLLGIKVTFHQSGQIRVTSIFDLNASFVFKSTRGSHSSLILDAMSDQVNVNEEILEMMRNWLGDGKGLSLEGGGTPCFMASVTLDAWERWRAGETISDLVREG
ncbi:spindle assembly checkpoint component Mad1 [Flagelloscypha sp. PMI_526]|nr:spindle assembly checkpoint component Mad1 [Flagelloscypha sp. PMI_526]